MKKMMMLRLLVFKRSPGSLHTHSTYCTPPRAIMEVVNAPRGLKQIPSPSKDKVLLLRKSILPPISELARREDRLAGLRIDADTNMKSREPWYTIEGIKNSQSKGPVQKIQGIPMGSRVHYFSWSKDGENICFTVQTNEGGVLSMLSFWVIHALSLQARPLLPPNMFLNAILFTDLFTWTNESTLVVPTIPLSRGPRPSRLLLPSGPIVCSNAQNKVVQVRTYQDLLKDEYDESLFEYYATSQLVSISLSARTGVEDDVKLVGQLGLYTKLIPSPFESYILVRSIRPPFSRLVTYKRFSHKVEVWNSITGDLIKDVCHVPLGDEIPCAEDSVRKGMRHIQWLHTKLPTLLWAIAQDGGNAKIKTYPRDIVYWQTLDSFGTQAPKVLTKLEFRFNDLTWKNKVLYVVEKWKKKLYTRPLSKSSCGATYEAGFGAIPCTAEVISCKRTDGKVVKANLYLPPVHDRPLPCLIWPYPIESGRKRAISPDSPQIWLRRGYAVITSLSMPEINDVDGDRYNTFIEELVKSIEAVVKEIIDRGVVHPEKISICGHSFGALMTSILLVHVPHLFCCGVAQSGAYNRTLTPFGYQAEYRTLWEATSSYLEMSIILSADKLKKPLLLIHGQEDENAGTWPMQSIRLYEALRGHGAECRLVILPLEGHGYVARESLLHVLWEMDTWFQTHVL